MATKISLRCTGSDNAIAAAAFEVFEQPEVVMAAIKSDLIGAIEGLRSNSRQYGKQRTIGGRALLERNVSKLLGELRARFKRLYPNENVSRFDRHTLGAQVGRPKRQNQPRVRS